MASSANSYPVTSSNAVDELWILKRQTQDGCQPSEYCSSSPSSEQDQYYTWSQSPQTEMERQPTASSTVYSKSEPSMRHRCPKKQCGSNFARFSDLSRHLRTVHGPKQQCLEPGCFYHTARSDNMREHCRRKHSNPSTPDQMSAEQYANAPAPVGPTMVYDGFDLTYDFVLFHEEIPTENWPSGDVLFQPLQ